MQTVQSERRRAPRKPVALAVEIDSKLRKNRVGVTRDTSETGVLLSTPSRFEVGDELDLRLYLSIVESVHVRAKVARLETVPPDSTDLWRYRLAVSFLQPVAGLTARLPS